MTRQEPGDRASKQPCHTVEASQPVRLRHVIVSATAALAVAAVPVVAPSAPSPLADPPAGAISANVEFLGNLAMPKVAIGAAFDGDVAFISAATGLYSVDIADPTAPALLGALPYYIWENEDVDYDAERKLLFVSRDPRGFTSPVAPAQLRLFGQVEIFDVSDPTVFVPVGAFTVPAGHTSTCVSAGEGPCDYLWTGGPYGNEALGPYGRPIYATDIRDPRNPVTCPAPINEGLMPDGDTGYAHDVQVDADGVAWVASETGVHGYWTAGEHVDATTGEVATATPCDPVPYGGGTSPADATPSRFMHNSWRNTTLTIPSDDPDEVAASRGAVLLATEENVVSDCASSGRFATYDLRSSLDGSGFTDTAGFEMTALDTWTPEAAEGSTGCASAHYFEDRGDGLLAYAFYGQGTRFLDVSDPTDIRQVGYFRPDDASVWAAYWHDGLVYVVDNTRGLDILRLTDDDGDAVGMGEASSLRTVEAPAIAAGLLAPATAYDPRTGYTCRLPLAVPVG